MRKPWAAIFAAVLALAVAAVVNATDLQADFRAIFLSPTPLTATQASDGLATAVISYVNSVGIEVGAPTTAEYVTSSANSTLTAERVATDTSSIDVDATVAGQMRWHVITPVSSASSLAADGGNCTLPQVALGVNAAGVAQCSQPSNVTGTAAALASDPTDCSAGQYAKAISANGNLTCGQVAYSEIAGAPTVPGASGTVAGETTFGQAASAGAAATYSRGDHTHGTPADPVTAHVAAGDPHTQYVIDGADINTLGGVLSIAKGGTTETGATEDAVLIGADTVDWAATVLPSCSSAASALTYDTAANSVGCNTLEPAGAYSGIGGCTNQFARTLNDSAAPTCASVDLATDTTATVLPIGKGGTTETASTEDAVLVGSSTTDWQPKVVPDCDVAATSKLLYDQATNAFSCGTDQAGAGGAWTTIEVNFGIVATLKKAFVVNDAGVTGTSRIMVQHLGIPGTGKPVDEPELDTLVCIGLPAAGSFTLSCRSLEGAVHGLHKVAYQIN